MQMTRLTAGQLQGPYRAGRTSSRLADPADVTAGAEGDGTAAEKQPATTTKPAEKPNAALVGLQRVIAEKDKEIASARSELAKLKGEPNVDEERAALQAELTELRNKSTVLELKAEFPELADIIDVAVAEDGKPPKKSVLAAWKAKMGTTESAPETSGVRNSPASQGNVSSEEAKFNRILKEAKLW
jgi:hypothetical protein